MIHWTQPSDWRSITGMPVAYTDQDHHHDDAAAQSILIKPHFKWILIGIVDILEALKVIEDNKLYCFQCFQPESIQGLSQFKDHVVQ